MTVLEEARELPTRAEAGVFRIWNLPEHEEFVGQFLGVGSSYRPRHTAHQGEFAGKGVKCHACRWFEARLFRLGEEADGDYLIYNVGRTIVPGETQRYKWDNVISPYEVVEIFTTRRLNTSAEPGSSQWSVHLSIPAARVLSQAAAFDVGLKDAYVNRAIA